MSADVDSVAGPAWTDPAACKPWCQSSATGHDWMSAGHCSTFADEIPLSVEEPVLMEGEEGSPTAVTVPDFVRVYLWYEPAEGVTINVSHHEDPGPVMTVPETRQLAGLLLRLADLAER